MSDPVSGTSVAAGGLMGASMFGLATGIDYGVVFGAFAGSVFYVVTAADISRIRLAGYFLTSFIVGVLGAGLAGSKLNSLTHYDKTAGCTGCCYFFSFMHKGAYLPRQSGSERLVWNTFPNMGRRFKW